ncbi:NAD(P)-binding protein [Xylaria grammica]|nr:NAD(P)-binding protein [Xylaria grammica]
MPSYVITGFELLRQISAEATNTVVGLVRNTSATEARVIKGLGQRSNIHIIHGDLDNHESLKKAAVDTATITGGDLDYLIANAGYISYWDSYDPIGKLLYTLSMPLILKGRVKKIAAISSSLSDLDSINRLGVQIFPLYAIVKAGLNIMNAKFSAQCKADGVLFLTICPGMVDVGHYQDHEDSLPVLSTPEQAASLPGMIAQFKTYAPHFEGPVATERAIKDLISVWERASIERGDGGDFVSHWGNKRWL